MANKSVDKLIEAISELSVLELSELVKGLQEKLGVSAMPVAAPTAGSGQAAGAEAAEEAGSGPATQTVVLTDAGTNKIGVIKALREINPQLGLKEAKDITEGLEQAPKEVLSNAKAEDAKLAKEKLVAAGAKVELK